MKTIIQLTFHKANENLKNNSRFLAISFLYFTIETEKYNCNKRKKNHPIGKVSSINKLINLINERIFCYQKK